MINKNPKNRNKNLEKKKNKKKSETATSVLPPFPLDIVKNIFQVAIGNSYAMYDLLETFNPEELNKISILKRMIGEAIKIQKISNSIEINSNI